MKDNTLVKNRLNSVRDLVNHGLIHAGDAPDLEKTEDNFAVGLSGHLVSLINQNRENIAITKQYIPDIHELDFKDSESNDPIGDAPHAPVKGIVHRYPDRVLLKAANVCAVYCRYCFRREMIGPDNKGLDAGELEGAISYIKQHREIWEVILTGGDPLVLSAKNLSEILRELEGIDHVHVIRIHTRIPIADPNRIKPALIEALKNLTKPCYIALHINHKDEITPDVQTVCAKLHEAGCTLLSQSVLLKDINDDADILEELLRALIGMNIKPYYLHHPDKAKGTSHFRLPLKRGMAIYQQLLGRMSGICQPSYMLDIPGGFGKIPVNHSYVEQTDKGRYIISDYNGNKHSYYDD